MARNNLVKCCVIFGSFQRHWQKCAVYHTNFHDHFLLCTCSQFSFISDLYCQKLPQQHPVRQDQHSHESGFQSATSLNSLEGPSHSKETQNSPPGSTLTGSTAENDRNLGNIRKLSSADSYGSLASSYLPQTRTSSILKFHQDELFSSKRSMLTQNQTSRIPRLPMVSRMDFVRQPYCALKPLFFEVPNACNESIFVGRQWLFREICEHLSSDLPTNRGVVIVGYPGTGKTTVVLQLVEHSCFGRSTDTSLQGNG